ncbi:MAG: PAS domain S-box protein [bacterium]
MRAALQESDETYRALVDNSLLGLFISQGWPPSVVFANHTFERIIGYSLAQLQTMSAEEAMQIVHPEDREIAFGNYQRRMEGEAAPARLVFRAHHRSGDLIWIEEYVTRIQLQGEPAIMAAVVDVTERKLAEQERERLIEDLQRALSEIKTLQGIIPICGHCKSVRDDQGYWTQVELYLRERADVEFSHGLCPTCVEQHYPEFATRRSEEK